MKENFRSFFLLAISILLAPGCSNTPGTKGYVDTPTTGEITIGCDESFAPICDAEVAVFEGIYRYSSIDIKYYSENDAIKALMADSVRLIVASRKLTEKEIAYFNSKKLFPRQTIIALDGVALIVNPKNTDTLLSVSNFKDILTGKIESWNDISAKNKIGKIQVVFDNPGSSTVRYVVDSITKKEKLSTRLSALQYNKDVVDYVAKHENALGVIGVNWVSDRDDSTCMSFLKKVRVVGIATDDKAIPDNSFKPYQAYIAQRKYPLIRYLYVINAEPRQGLASGFAAFVASDRGQRIILKSGILPATQPVRIIQVKEDF